MSTCKISGCLSYRILDSGPDGTQTTLTEKLGLNLSTHSMRKSKPTIGYDNGEDIAVISKALGHKSLSSTLHYIGATQRKVDDFSDKYSIEDLL
ncbi:tyrosine-type recombinase/integrase [Enterobacter cloacae]|uniref:tyrosine-type recombinase/integrase n=1 Tax=Enterobacter cloacae TaxID=550 RepID=UPI00350EE346